MKRARTELRPTKGLLQGAEYINAVNTDIRARFERMKREQQQKPSVTSILRKRHA